MSKKSPKSKSKHQQQNNKTMRLSTDNQEKSYKRKNTKQKSTNKIKEKLPIISRSHSNSEIIRPTHYMLSRSRSQSQFYKPTNSKDEKIKALEVRLDYERKLRLKANVKLNWVQKILDTKFRSLNIDITKINLESSKLKEAEDKLEKSLKKSAVPKVELYPYKEYEKLLFRVGDTVQLTKLQKQELNGQKASIVGHFMIDKRRWPITMEHGRQLSIKTRNLKFMHAKNNHKLQKKIDDKDISNWACADVTKWFNGFEFAGNKIYIPFLEGIRSYNIGGNELKQINHLSLKLLFGMDLMKDRQLIMNEIYKLIGTVEPEDNIVINALRKQVAQQKNEIFVLKRRCKLAQEFEFNSASERHKRLMNGSYCDEEAEGIKSEYKSNINKINKQVKSPEVCRSDKNNKSRKERKLSLRYDEPIGLNINISAYLEKLTKYETDRKTGKIVVGDVTEDSRETRKSGPFIGDHTNIKKHSDGSLCTMTYCRCDD